MRLLDLFCGAGGAAMGYHRAGFEVVGVDNRPQPNYPFEFVQGDAVAYAENLARGMRMVGPPWTFDVVHASPPCQAYVRSGMVAKDGRHPDLVGPTKEALQKIGLPWVIENVPGAPIRPDIVLCGSMFGLGVRRHRWFETSWGEPVMTLACDHSKPITGVYGHPNGEGASWRNGNRPRLPSDSKTWAEAMGIDWMHPLEMAQAIPPAYTEFIGNQLMAQLMKQAA